MTLRCDHRVMAVTVVRCTSGCRHGRSARPGRSGASSQTIVAAADLKSDHINPYAAHADLALEVRREVVQARRFDNADGSAGGHRSGRGHQPPARTVEHVFAYLKLNRLYIRLLRAWVFGEMGTLARHGDLAEDEHRRWVLRAVMALVGWLEYLGGEEDAVEKLVERLELEAGEAEVDEVAG